MRRHIAVWGWGVLSLLCACSAQSDKDDSIEPTGAMALPESESVPSFQTALELESVEQVGVVIIEHYGGDPALGSEGSIIAAAAFTQVSEISPALRLDFIEGDLAIDQCRVDEGSSVLFDQRYFELLGTEAMGERILLQNDVGYELLLQQKAYEHGPSYTGHALDISARIDQPLPGLSLSSDTLAAVALPPLNWLEGLHPAVGSVFEAGTTIDFSWVPGDSVDTLIELHIDLDDVGYECWLRDDGYFMLPDEMPDALAATELVRARRVARAVTRIGSQVLIGIRYAQG